MRHVWIVLFLAVVVACSAPSEVRRPSAPPVPPAPEFHPGVDEVRSIQLYAEQERNLPVYRLRSGVPLTLEFDILNWNPRPLSVYFYHADRVWRRDLTPGEYLEAFDRDNLFDYELSRATLVQYSHYRYRFPNAAIAFRLSVNYVLRVTEQGKEAEVLFERPFFVTEDVAGTQMHLDLLMTGRLALPAVQPHLLVLPPAEVGASLFDLSVCFFQGGHILTPRCIQRPSISGQSELLYYLDPEDAYGVRVGDYYLDLRQLLPRDDIEHVDRASTPYVVHLQPDYARFPDNDWGPLQTGQSVISGRDGVADTQAEYVHVVFHFVPPDGKPLPGGLYVTGSFNGWRVDLGSAMTWQSDAGQYESRHLIKQGVYEYRYTSPDPEVQRALQVRLLRPDQLYTGLVYFRDTSLGTDRILAVSQVFSK